MTRNVTDRRTVLKAGGVALTTGVLSGCTAGGRSGSGGTTATDSGGSSDAETATSDATATESDTETTATESADGPTATVDVGPGGRLAFEPSGDRPLVVAAGTTVEFVWGSDVHNVVVDDRPSDGDWEGSPGDSDDVYDKGYAFSHAFEVPGIYDFHCEPHETLGMTGTIVVTPEGVPTEYATRDDLPVNVGPDGDPVFAPGTVRPLKVSVGTEVEFVWESDDHNVVVTDQPETGDWEGTAGDPTTVYDEGHEHGHAFEVPGVYRFECQSHRVDGMVGIVVVEE